MISHDRAQELISARMDAPLTPAEHRELQGHLASCTACRDFVMQADEIARNLQVMPRLAQSPMVSRAVMQAISTESSGWGWLRRGLQTLSSPGMAVASSFALVVALASALIVALNAPGGNNPGQGVASQSTIAALADEPMPTEVPTAAPDVPTPPPTQASETETKDQLAVAQPTATERAARAITPKPTEPTRMQAPQPTATSVPIVAASDESPSLDSPQIEPANGGEIIYEEPVEEPTLAMAEDTGEPSAELAQEAVIEQPAENVDTGESVEPVASEPEGEAVSETDNSAQESDGDRKGNGKKDVPAEETTEPEPTRPIGPVPAEAIRALEGAGDMAPDIYLPPAPLDPNLPDQSFLPETPAPEWEGTPTPESDSATEAEAPQLADDWSGNLDITGLAPEEPVLAEAPDSTTSEKDRIKEKEKRDKSSREGESHEEQQAAFSADPLGWSSQPMAFQQTAGEAAEPAELQQTTDVPADAATTTGEPADPANTAAEPMATAEPERQIDPATGMEIDPATGYLIDPTTGYLLDVVNDRIIDPRTSYEVHPMTGLLIDPASGALLDPNTLAVVVPPGFGDDQPLYVPGSDEMHGDIESVVDDTYNNASIRLEPPTDGPVQPVGEIVVPTESGEAVEIS